jgi:hypothetical protein
MTCELQTRPLPHDFVTSRLTDLRSIRYKYIKQVSDPLVPCNNKNLTHRTTIIHQTKTFRHVVFFSFYFLMNLSHKNYISYLQNLTKPHCTIMNGVSVAPTSEVR